MFFLLPAVFAAVHLGAGHGVLAELIASKPKRPGRA
jgi:hypothetical protein